MSSVRVFRSILVKHTVVCFMYLCGVLPSLAYAQQHEKQQTEQPNYLAYPQVQEFIREQVVNGRDQQTLETLFASITKNDRVIELMNYAPERRKNWGDYRQIFLTQERITKGKKFADLNKSTLERAEQIYGIPAHIIVAILGVETMYGERVGGHKVARSLATLAFDYPRRKRFFRKELVHFLRLSETLGVDPLSLTGSYAGAMGYPQFMPSSYLAYAVDFDDDEIIDIWQGSTDPIGSVANYLKKAGWKSRPGILEKVTSEYPEAFMALSNQTLRPDIVYDRLSVLGVRPQILVDESKVILLTTEADGQKELWLGGHNFYVITRYNHSRLYALAVYHLAEEIRK